MAPASISIFAIRTRSNDAAYFNADMPLIRILCPLCVQSDPKRAWATRRDGRPRNGSRGKEGGTSPVSKDDSSQREALPRIRSPSVPDTSNLARTTHKSRRASPAEPLPPSHPQNPPLTRVSCTSHREQHEPRTPHAAAP
eukprot:CAMPEP_0170170012 /NCGR_PEP_ID=MMETSP0040_2-20121228/2968_1 /TAXON_ID=641309 /ORGANISM="Lotharella oceanica, Strain CCMP622" /LENGTH=139 /DNA_ID=CAMNT_0010409117 /DNA_START=434 /DNA_END=854 /DNA_ORIENTATION=+